MSLRPNRPPLLAEENVPALGAEGPPPLGRAQLVEQALAVLRADRVCFLATADGDQPRLRPVAPVKTDGFTVYVVNLQGCNKTREIAGNPKVELCYLDQHHAQVRIA